MGMTMTQKILAMHVGREFVEAGDLLVSQVDLILANDITEIKSRWYRIIFLPAKTLSPQPCVNRCVILPGNITSPTILR